MKPKRPSRPPRYRESNAATLAHYAAMGCETLQQAALGGTEIQPDEMRELFALLIGIRRSADAAYRIMRGREPNRRMIAAAVTDCGRPRSSQQPS